MHLRLITQNFIFLVIAAIVSSAAFSGFYSKWGLREGSALYGVEQIIHGEASRPFVYRQLIPFTVRVFDRWIPDSLKSHYPNIPPGKPFFYKCAYALTFLFYFLSFLTLVRLCLDFGADFATATLSSSVFLLALPYFQSGGGYYYDSAEVFFMVTSMLLALRSQWIILGLLIPLATLNKESFLFFIPCLFPFLKKNQGVSKKVVVFLTMLLLEAALINLFIKQKFVSNPGAPVEFNLVSNMESLFDIRTYGLLELTYGLPGPSNNHIIILLFLFVICRAGWKRSPSDLKHHFIIACIINAPLFIFFGRAGELRGLSFLYPALTVFLSKWISYK